MAIDRYADLNQKMIEHFQNGEFRQALELVEKEGGRFPENRPMVDYWMMCAAARVDDRKRVYTVAEKFHKDGLWYGEFMWRLTPSFKPLQGVEDFERLVAESRNLEEQDLTNRVNGDMKLLPQNLSKNTPLLIALHGNQSSARATLPFWRGAVDAGFALVIPQSTQAIFKNAYIWDDLELSFAQVKACYEITKKELNIDPDKIVVAGHSMGGLVAIQMALTSEIPVRKLIVNGPALPFEDAPEEMEKAISSAKDRNLRVYFIVGEKDVDIEQDAVKAFAAVLKSSGIACEFEIIPGATHDYNPDYDAALQRALAYVNL